MATFSIAVYGAPYSSSSSYSAWRFAQAVIAKGHQLNRVFFYHDGIQNATRLAVVPQDNYDLTSRWQTLSTEHNVDLVVCIASALKRGLLNNAEAQRYDRDTNNLSNAFSIGGLGQLIDAAVSTDRFVTFGD